MAPFTGGHRPSPRSLAKRPPSPILSRRFGVQRFRARTSLVLLCGTLVLLYIWRDSLLEQHTFDGPVRTPAPQPIVREPFGQKVNEFYEVDGLLYSRMQNSGRHPILHLIAEAQKSWRRKLGSQSRTLQDAVREYERRYKRRPPKGFDKWFSFAVENGVVLLDEYDQISRDLDPFYGLPTELLRQRSKHLVEDSDNYYHQGAYTIHIHDGKVVNVSGPWADNTRAVASTDLLERYVKWLPDMNITVWLHDTPVIHTAGENKVRYVELANRRSTLPTSEWEDAQDKADFPGWEAFCSPDSNLRQSMAGKFVGRSPLGRSFVSDHAHGMEICRHPEFLNLHSLTSNYGKTSMYSDILITPIEQYDAETGPDPAWEDKPINKMVWRGSTTGSRYDRMTLWRPTQRSRLNMRALVTNDAQGAREVLLADAHGMQRSVPDVPTSTLNTQLFDVAFTGEPVQCDANDGTCAALKHIYRFEGFMDDPEANQYKYVVDIDGNGWSGRYHRLLSTNAMVLKSTAFVEWYQDRIQPWVHYVPVKLDYSDLYHIMTFFVGLNGVDGHDDMAKEIALAGKRWAAEHWRFEDMEAYMFRLYLEYARVMGPRDGSMDHED